MMNYKEKINCLETGVKKYSNSWVFIKAQNKTKNIEIDEEILKERYISS